MIDDQLQIQLADEAEPQAVELVKMPYEDRVASLDEMVKSIRENRNPSTSIEDNINSFKLTCMAIASARSGQKIKTQEFLPFPSLKHS